MIVLKTEADPLVGMQFMVDSRITPDRSEVPVIYTVTDLRKQARRQLRQPAGRGLALLGARVRMDAGVV